MYYGGLYTVIHLYSGGIILHQYMYFSDDPFFLSSFFGRPVNVDPFFLSSFFGRSVFPLCVLASWLRPELRAERAQFFIENFGFFGLNFAQFLSIFGLMMSCSRIALISRLESIREAFAKLVRKCDYINPPIIVNGAIRYVSRYTASQ